MPPPCARSGVEWMTCLLISVGVFPVSFLTRYFTHVYEKAKGIDPDHD